MRVFDFMFQLNAPICLLHLSHSSTCFEQPYAHHQEDSLYTYSIWFFLFVEPDGCIIFIQFCFDGFISVYNKEIGALS